nr:MAG TPA: protein of unknown function (DUF5486) [Caudoviricetes sp.]
MSVQVLMRDENYRPRGFLIASKVEMMRRLNRPDNVRSGFDEG